MNRLFEEFVGRFILRHRRRILPAHWERAEVRLQSQGRPAYLAERLPARSAAFRLVPDVLVTHRSAATLLVLDTKYKQLDAEARRLGIAEADMYQMVAYAMRLGCRRVLLVYPEWPAAPHVPVEFVVPGAGIHIVVATINLRQPLSRPKGLIQEVEALFNLAASPLAQEVV
jgi:5-methylcytosine-specific restriction enzyme subunit McrC